MGKSLDWVREDPKTGRLLFRRAYPVSLRPFLPEPRRGHRELKVPLRARREMTPEAFGLYEGAKRQFAADVRRAKAASDIEGKRAAGVADPLTPELVAYLVARRKADALELDAEVRWLARSREVKLRAHRRLTASTREDLDEALQLRALGDIAAIIDAWGDEAVSIAADEGFQLDRADPLFPEYVRALHDGVIASWEIILRRLAGEDVPTPPPSERPEPSGAPRVRTVSELIAAYEAEKRARWRISTRTAFDPVARLLRDFLGNHTVPSVDRGAAREVLEIVKALPVRMGSRRALAGLSVCAAVEEGRRLGLETIGPATINRGYMSHISALFGFAVKEGWTASNPFVGLGVADPVAAIDKRDPFTIPQLQKLFTAAPWDSPTLHEVQKPGRYWVPLIALFTGMRLGEAAGLRVIDVEELDGIPCFRLRPYDSPDYGQRRLKNDESRRDVPVHTALERLGLLSFVAHRKNEAQPGDLLFPDGKPNVRGQWGAKLGEWFVSHLRGQEIKGTKLGMHSFRHVFEDRLRAVGLSGRPEGLRLTGRAGGGTEGDYGSGYVSVTLQAALERVTYPGLDLSHLERA